MNIQGRPLPEPVSQKSTNKPAKEIEIGSYDEGWTDLSDKVTVRQTGTAASKEAALEQARKQPGAELIVEKVKPSGGLAYDVYNLTIHDKGQKIHKLQDAENLKLIDNAVAQVGKQSGTQARRAFLVAENGEAGTNIYARQFERTAYDKLRATVGLDDSKMWFKLVDKYMSAPSPEDAFKPIDRAEIQAMKAHIKPGDILLNGNNGSFIHGIVYVGEDKAIQAQLEKKWGLKPGELNGEAMILHSLAVDEDTSVEVNGQQEVRKAGGVGVIMDTLERYTDRHPRDMMIAVGVKGATEADRKAVIEEGKKFVGKGYDNGFNTYDDRDMYCTEFVMKSWMGAQDSPPDFKTQLHALAPKTSVIPFVNSFKDKLPDGMRTTLEDDGILYQEMLMTDGIITSPSVELKWASQNADQSEFFKKHTRWADGLDGKISKGYQELVTENVPEQAAKSRDLLSQIQNLAEKTRTELKK